MTAKARKPKRGRPKGSGLRKEKCLQCDNQAVVLGVCGTCYQAGRRELIRTGKVHADGSPDWSSYEKRGLVLPNRQGQGEKPNAFKTKLASLKTARTKKV